MITLSTRLAHRERLGNRRSLQTADRLVDLASNDYLGLAHSPSFAQKVREDWKGGTGSTGSRLLTGNSAYAEALEEKIARFHGFETGLLFNCGYMANLGLLSSVITPKDTVFYDAHAHASIQDGIRLSRGAAVPFKHNNLDHLKKRLAERSGRGERFLCVESLYSTDGSRAPLQEIGILAEQFGVHLIVDEAHAVGILGPKGRGLVEGMVSQVFAQVVTFGKALGVSGAIVLGSGLLKDYLINFSRTCVYTTFLPPAVLTSISCSYDLLPLLDEERAQVLDLINHFKSLFGKGSDSPIQALLFKGNQAVRDQAKKCARHGFDVRPLMSPTVRRGEERIRLNLHAFNTKEELTRLHEIWFE